MTTTTLTLSYASDTYTLSVALTSSVVTVSVQNARDAYQLAVAEGFVGTRAEWLASLQGTLGLAAVIVTEAEYLALAPEVQLDPTKWFVIPRIL